MAKVFCRLDGMGCGLEGSQAGQHIAGVQHKFIKVCIRAALGVLLLEETLRRQHCLCLLDLLHHDGNTADSLRSGTLGKDVKAPAHLQVPQLIKGLHV